MQKKNLLIVTTALMFVACNEPLNEVSEVITNEEFGTATETSIILGEKLNNPYTLENMRKAIEELDKSGLSKTALSTDIKPTHYYIKFKPKNESDIDKLDSDTTVFFYDYPLDYEIVQEGDFYHDPELPDSVPTYQYCAVEVGHKLPDVEYEILEDLYILEDVNGYENADETDNSISKFSKVDYWDDLETIARRLAGYDVELSKKRSKWKPEGYIRYQDSEKGVVPMNGVPVHMRKNMFVGRQCCTDANGYFSFSTIKAKVEFLIRWKRSDFKVKNTSSTAANVMLAKNTRSAVDRTFNVGETQWRYASAFRAAINYYYGNIYNLSKPPSDMRMYVLNKAMDVSIITFDYTGTFNPVVYHDTNGTEISIYTSGMSSRDIFAATTRQLAKSVMWNIYMRNNDIYKSSDEQLKKAWSDDCASFLTQCYYDRNYTSSKGIMMKKEENALKQTTKYNEWINIIRR